MIVTEQILNQCLTKGCGISDATHLALTGKKKVVKGWRRAILGSEITDQQLKDAIYGKKTNRVARNKSLHLPATQGQLLELSSLLQQALQRIEVLEGEIGSLGSPG